MSKSPSQGAPNVTVTSPTTPGPISEEYTTGIPLGGLNRRRHDSQSTIEGPTTPTEDRKGKGKARAVDPVDELENYDPREEADTVRVELTHGNNVFGDDNDDTEYAEDSVGDTSSGNGQYPPIGDDDLEERRVTEVRTALHTAAKMLCQYYVFIRTYSAFPHPDC